MDNKKIQSEAVITLSKFQGGSGCDLYESSQIAKGGFSMTLSTAREYDSFGEKSIMPGNFIAKVDMTYTQFAQLITNIGVGSGVPVTLNSLREYEVLPLNKKKNKIDEVIDYGIESNLEQIKEILELAKKLTDKPNKTNKEALLNRVQNIESNLSFYEKRVREVAEKERVKIKSEIENSAVAVFTEIGERVVGKAMIEKNIDSIENLTR